MTTKIEPDVVIDQPEPAWSTVPTDHYLKHDAVRLAYYRAVIDGNKRKAAQKLKRWGEVIKRPQTKKLKLRTK